MDSLRSNTPLFPKIFLSLKEVIAATGCSRSTILRLVASGMPHIQFQKGSRLKFKLGDVEHWMLEKFGHGDSPSIPKKRGPGRPRKYAKGDE